MSRVKLVWFVPLEALEATRQAVFEAGAGRIGEYERCSWYTAGTGTFLGGESSHYDPLLVENDKVIGIPTEKHFYLTTAMADRAIAWLREQRSQSPDGRPLIRRWNATSVYQRMAGRWRIVHQHWSLTKPELKDPASGV